MGGSFYLVDKSVLPDVYKKVVNAKKLLKEGKVKDITEAAKVVGISRSVYYKYKDYVFDFSESSEGRKATFNISIIDEKGVLSNIINYVSNSGGNIITIHQGIPLNGYAFITITIDMSLVEVDIKTLLDGIGKINRVEKAEFIAME